MPGGKSIVFHWHRGVIEDGNSCNFNCKRRIFRTWCTIFMKLTEYYYRSDWVFPFRTIPMERKIWLIIPSLSVSVNKWTNEHTKHWNNHPNFYLNLSSFFFIRDVLVSCLSDKNCNFINRNSRGEKKRWTCIAKQFRYFKNCLQQQIFWVCGSVEVSVWTL